MLSNLKITNVAVIEKAEIAFENGLNILTGETGAGKSIVIDSLNAVLGERSSKDLVRTGADSAKVSAFFEGIPKRAEEILTEFEVETEEDGSLLVSRTITADGRSSCRVNGQPVTVSMLKALGRELITICGQHDSQHLLQKESHLAYIDALADIESEKEEYKLLYKALLKKEKEFASINKDEAEKQQRLEFLNYQVNELQNANITLGEKEELTAQKMKIQNRERVASALYGAKMLIGGDDNTPGISDLLYNLKTNLYGVSEFSKSFEAFLSSCEDFGYELDDCLSNVTDELYELEETDLDINYVEQRLDLLYRLSKKYGETEEEMLSYLEKITEELDSLQSSDEREQKLEEEIAALKEEVFEKAKLISEKRKQSAKQFEQDVKTELNYLDMNGAQFLVLFEESKPTENGIDDVQFLISVNSGQAPKPLSKIASGGELSRVMLAIRCVLSDSESSNTMIFDEIDTGVSGRAAHKIAYKLRQVSKGKQILCVTHLAQIAAGADNHLMVEKNSDSEKTYTVVRKLVDDERIREIARIIGGDVVTKTTMMSACELIDFANNP